MLGIIAGGYWFKYLDKKSRKEVFGQKDEKDAEP